MKIGIIGCGYVGLTSAVGFALWGNDVLCFERDMSRLEKLSAGETPFYEPQMLQALSEVIADGRLRFAKEQSAKNISELDVVFLAVGTSPSPNGDDNMKNLYEVGEFVATLLKDGGIIVIKSTADVGFARRFAEKTRQHNIKIGVNPEFLSQGSTLKDFLSPARIVLGACDEEVFILFRRLYQSAIGAGIKIVECDWESAEISKLAANLALASRVALVNELDNLCKAVGADIDKVAKIVGMDKRFGSAYFSPSPGFGGSCLPKDCAIFSSAAKRAGAVSFLSDAVLLSNEARIRHIADKIAMSLKNLSKQTHTPTVALLGLAFKSGTDDARDSPALEVARILLKRGYFIQAHEPQAIASVKTFMKPEELKQMKFYESPQEAVIDAHACAVLVAWPQYMELSHKKLEKMMSGGDVLDFCNGLS